MLRAPIRACACKKRWHERVCAQEQMTRASARACQVVWHMGVSGVVYGSIWCGIWEYLVWHMGVSAVVYGSIWCGIWEYLLWYMGVSGVAYGSIWCGIWEFLVWYMGVSGVVYGSICCGIWEYLLCTCGACPAQKHACGRHVAGMWQACAVGTHSTASAEPQCSSGGAPTDYGP